MTLVQKTQTEFYDVSPSELFVLFDKPAFRTIADELMKQILQYTFAPERFNNEQRYLWRKAFAILFEVEESAIRVEPHIINGNYIHHFNVNVTRTCPKD